MRSRAICRPMPPPAPVTTAVLPANSGRSDIVLKPARSRGSAPIGDPAIVLELLPAAGVQIVLDHVVAERRAQDRGPVQTLERLAQRLRTRGMSLPR